VTTLILAANFPAYVRGTVEDAADRLKEIGYEGVGFSSDPRYGYHLLSARDDTAEYIRNVFHDRKLKIVQIYQGCNLISPDERIRRRSIEAVKKAIGIAEKLDCPAVGCSTGSLAHSFFSSTPHPDNYSKKGWNLTINALREILKATEGTDVRFCVQPAWYTSIYSLDTLTRSIEEVGHPNLKVLLDPVNLIAGWLDRYLNVARWLNEFFDILGENIFAAHGKDVVVEFSRGTFSMLSFCETVPGQGVMDYETFVRRLCCLGPQISLLVEHLGSDDQYVEAYQHINKVRMAVG